LKGNTCACAKDIFSELQILNNRGLTQCGSTGLTDFDVINGEITQYLNDNNNQMNSANSTGKVTKVLLRKKRTFACKLCNKIFLCKAHWLEHRTEELTFECPFCCKRLKYKGNIKKHIIQAHRNTNSENEIAAACRTLNMRAYTVKIKSNEVETLTVNKAREAVRTYSSRRQISRSVPEAPEESNTESLTRDLDADCVSAPLLTQDYNPVPTEKTVTPIDFDASGCVRKY